MPYRTKIVFSHGEEVGVRAQVWKVRRRLSKDRRAGRAFTKLKTGHGTDVYVAVGQVAYIEQVPEGLMGASIIRDPRRTRTRHMDRNRGDGKRLARRTEGVGGLPLLVGR